MKRHLPLSWLALIAIFFIYSCDPVKNIPASDDGKIEFIILQTNDVYEISPLEGGTVGGMARVAQIKKELLAENPNTMAVMAGDFLNPSVIGTLKYEGERIRGKQMVETMNVAGIDLVTFGNHEFDLDENDLLQRIEESDFGWTVSNVLHNKNGKLSPFQHKGKDIPTYWIKEFKDADGTSVKVGFISLCLNSNDPDYVHYEDPFLKFKQTHLAIKNKVDIVIGLTHQSIEDDMKLAAEVEGIPLIMGGHEHNNMKHKVKNTIITKADANAKTVYVHYIRYDKKTKKVRLISDLTRVDETIAKEPKTEAVVQKWTKIANAVLLKSGINPNEIIVKLDEPIDATETVVRHRPSVIGKIIVQAISQASPHADAALMNTGSIRIDDILSGQITQYDVVRILPFGGGDVVVKMKGDLLLKTLEIGLVTNVGKGGYFAVDNMTFNPKDKTGTIKGQPIDANKVYAIAIPEFLLTGLEANLGFLKDIPPADITVANTKAQKDIRIAVIDYLKNNPIPSL